MIERIPSSTNTNALSSLMNLMSSMMPMMQMMNAMMGLMSSMMGKAVNEAMAQLSKDAGMPKFIRDEMYTLSEKTFGGKTDASPEAEQAATKLLTTDAKGSSAAAGGTTGDAKAKMTENLTKQIVENVKEAREEDDKKANGKSGGKGTGGWLVALAKAFGKVADAAAAELKKQGENIDKENPSSMLEYQAKTQEFNLMMQTFTNAIKTIGEAEGQAVRKG